MAANLKIRKNAHFKKIYSEGRYYVEENIVAYIMKNHTEHNKVGFSVSKKVGKAVTRNKVKRWMKENYRSFSADMKRGYDIVFTARVKAANADFYIIQKNMASALTRAKLIKK